MKMGKCGEAVEILQQVLIDQGFKMPNSIFYGKPDSVYRQEIVNTVWKFQDSEKLSRDGIAGARYLAVEKLYGRAFLGSWIFCLDS